MPSTAGTAVARRTAERVRKVLARRGRSLAVETDDDADPLAEQEPLLARCYGAAVHGVALLGDGKGTAPARLTRPTEVQREESTAVVLGFNVHAKVAVDRRDRARLERASVTSRALPSLKIVSR